MPVAPYTLEQAETDIADLRAQVDRLGEVTPLDGTFGVVPNAQPNQAQMFVSAGQPAYVNPAGLTANLSAGQLANVTPVVATAAGAGTNLGGLFIPGGDCAAGSVYKLSCFGFGVVGSTQSSNGLTWAVSLGGVAGGSETTGTGLITTSTGFRFYAEATCVCITPGSSGTFYMSLSVQFTQAGVNVVPGTAGQQTGGLAAVATTAATVDSTTGETLRINAAWAATAGTTAPTLTSVAAWGQRIA